MFDLLSLAVLVPKWGIEKVLDFAKQIAAQDPIWVRCHTKPLTAVMPVNTHCF
jgi:hypothetical protein